MILEFVHRMCMVCVFKVPLNLVSTTNLLACINVIAIKFTSNCRF